jgi:hypothetical protein
MANITVPNGRGVVIPREVVQEKVAAVLARHPELLSFDPLDAKYENILMRLKTDPGPPHSQRDGWEGMVCDWYFGTYTMTDDTTGELVTLPSLALVTSDGVIVRMTNSEPAVRSWLVILGEIGPERVTAGRHYWQILPA